MADQASRSNENLIAGLREVADWLEAHPELPELGATIYGFPHAGHREQLTVVARALGDRAREGLERDRVSIKGQFGVVPVRVEASVQKLGAEAPVPLYEPIIGVS